jgi:hypothetical protein
MWMERLTRESWPVIKMGLARSQMPPVTRSREIFVQDGCIFAPRHKNGKISYLIRSDHTMADTDQLQA